jgi:hypothetical protein
LLTQQPRAAQPLPHEGGAPQLAGVKEVGREEEIQYFEAVLAPLSPTMGISLAVSGAVAAVRGAAEGIAEVSYDAFIPRSFRSHVREPPPPPQVMTGHAVAW